MRNDFKVQKWNSLMREVLTYNLYIMVVCKNVLEYEKRIMFVMIIRKLLFWCGQYNFMLEMMFYCCLHLVWAKALSNWNQNVDYIQRLCLHCQSTLGLHIYCIGLHILYMDIQKFTSIATDKPFSLYILRCQYIYTYFYKVKHFRT